MPLTLPHTLSPSKVASFKDCALAFRFSVIDRLPEPPSAPAVKGTLVHRALELLLCLPPGDRTVAAGLDCLERARRELATDPEMVALAMAAEDEAAFVAEAEVLVRKYFEIEDPTRIRPIGLELMMEAKLGGVRLRGVIDRLELDEDGELVVTDYKTGKVPGVTYEQSKLGGVHFYAYLCQEVLGRRPVKVQLLYLSEPLAIITEPSEQSVNGLRMRAGAIWSAVERACERDDFRPRPSRLCDWCSFKAWCPSFGGDPSLAGKQLLVAQPA